MTTAPRRPARRAVACAILALGAAALLLPADDAEARPQHLKIFAKLYGKKSDGTIPEEDIKKTKCKICHDASQKSMKFRNPYGMALSKIVKKNEKDAKVFTEALEKVAKEKSCVEEKTYGDVIKGGELPAKNCPPQKDPDPNPKRPVPTPDPNF